MCGDSLVRRDVRKIKSQVIELSRSSGSAEQTGPTTLRGIHVHYEI